MDRKNYVLLHPMRYLFHSCFWLLCLITTPATAAVTRGTDPEARLPDGEVGDDSGSIYPADGSLSAHFEHTVAITADGPRVLTVC